MWLSYCLHLSSSNKQSTNKEDNVKKSLSSFCKRNGGEKEITWICLLAFTIKNMLEDTIKIYQFAGHNFYNSVLIAWLIYLHGCGEKGCCCFTTFSLSVKYRKCTKRDSYLPKGGTLFFPQWWKSPVEGKVDTPHLLAAWFICAHKAPTGFKGRSVPNTLATYVVEAK